MPCFCEMVRWCCCVLCVLCVCVMRCGVVRCYIYISANGLLLLQRLRLFTPYYFNVRIHTIVCMHACMRVCVCVFDDNSRKRAERILLICGFGRPKNGRMTGIFISNGIRKRNGHRLLPSILSFQFRSFRSLSPYCPPIIQTNYSDKRLCFFTVKNI